jgi:hypothetical protein
MLALDRYGRRARARPFSSRPTQRLWSGSRGRCRRSWQRRRGRTAGDRLLKPRVVPDSRISVSWNTLAHLSRCLRAAIGAPVTSDFALDRSGTYRADSVPGPTCKVSANRRPDRGAPSWRPERPPWRAVRASAGRAGAARRSRPTTKITANEQTSSKHAPARDTRRSPDQQERPGQGHNRRVRRQGLEPRTRGLRVRCSRFLLLQSTSIFTLTRW